MAAFQVAPTGVLSAKKLADTLLALVALNRTSHALPELWSGYTPAQVTHAVATHFPDQDVVDWRVLLLRLTGPWPLPATASLHALNAQYWDIDFEGLGVMAAAHFKKVPLWFEHDATGPAADRDKFDRLAHVRDAVADIYAAADGAVDYTAFVRTPSCSAVLTARSCSTHVRTPHHWRGCRRPYIWPPMPARRTRRS